MKQIMETNKDGLEFNNLVKLFEQTQNELQNHAARSVDIALVIRNWLFGWYIVEFEQHGADRAQYGAQFIKTLSTRLKHLKIKGSSATRLKLYRSFYQKYQNISPTVSTQSEALAISPTVSVESFRQYFGSFIKHLADQFELGWSHYVTLQTIRSTEGRKFYEIEAIENSWSVRELQRQINSSFYERLSLSRDKAKIKELSQKGQLIGNPEDILKNPYILEFLDLPEHPHYSEHQLETAIIDKIEHFLLELGKGFLFEARQKRFTFENDHFYVDLVFYNRLLRCYVLIDLKRDKLTHQDLGQMQMYVNYFDRFVKLKHEAPTVGIVLCHQKNDAVVELTLPEDSNIHASEYQLYLPSKEDFIIQIEVVREDDFLYGTNPENIIIVDGEIPK
jgi:predicted nuclease of restriction endonuclease-like (RecB) superfamily